MPVVWVLGAAGGVGSIVCQNLSEKGWDVVGSGRTEDTLQALSSEISNIEILPIDARDDVAMKQAVASICLLYTSPSPRDLSTSRMPSSA